jgi:hypothetical protein
MHCWTSSLVISPLLRLPSSATVIILFLDGRS